MSRISNALQSAQESVSDFSTGVYDNLSGYLDFGYDEQTSRQSIAETPPKDIEEIERANPVDINGNALKSNFVLYAVLGVVGAVVGVYVLNKVLK